MFDSFNMVHGAAPETLIVADGDHGYGNAMNVQRTVRAYGRAGAAAVLIEDKITPRALTSAGKPCLPRDEARMKIRAAVEAAKESGILILARTDCRPTQGIDEAVARIEMYVQEGADILFLDSPADDEEIRRAIAAAAGRPSFAVLSPGAPRATPSQSQAAALGFKIGTYPTGMLVPGDGWHEGGPGGAGRRRGGRGERALGRRIALYAGVSGLRRAGEGFYRAGIIRRADALVADALSVGSCRRKTLGLMPAYA